ncbi:Derlin-2/3 [Nematocida homosporus]|uniref:Derlin-2/3 n=1 Tax=Nematocida homosporus TaxID=1912981 RepID=UPI00221FEDE8|nr:Derlin-2/3 [Nematocida homosporus]KAI5187003.1 Derlin-2/3 [Nematocida homosporus]
MHIETLLINQYRSIPIVSRLFFTISISLTLLTYLDFISPYSLIYSWAHLQKLEIWRALTTFFYWGPASLDVFIHQFFMLKYCVMLEEACSDPSDFLYLLIVGMALIFGMGNILGMAKMSNALSTYIIYIWSKRNPLILVQYMGLFNLPAYYVPCIMFLFSFIVEKKLPQSDLVGIVAGHIYFYFKHVYVKTSTSEPLRTPLLLKRLFQKPKSTSNSNTNGQSRSSPTQNSPNNSATSLNSSRIRTLDDIQANG